LLSARRLASWRKASGATDAPHFIDKIQPPQGGGHGTKESIGFPAGASEVGPYKFQPMTIGSRPSTDYAVADRAGLDLPQTARVRPHDYLYLTRNKGAVWERPSPSWKLVVPAEASQLLGTLVVVYGLFMAPTGWSLALMVWAYTLVSFFVASATKIDVYRFLDHRAPRQARHLQGVEGHVAAQFSPLRSCLENGGERSLI
jgi:hypothetical protein